MRRHISQREAHATARLLRERVRELASFKNKWALPYSGVEVCAIPLVKQGDVDVLHVVPKLGRILIARLDGVTLNIYAVPM